MALTGTVRAGGSALGGMFHQRRIIIRSVQRCQHECSSLDFRPKSHSDGHHKPNADDGDDADPFLDGPMEMVKQVADDIRESVREYTSTWKQQDRPPIQLVAITASRSLSPSTTNNGCHVLDARVDHGTDRYSEWIARTCREDGIAMQTWRVSGGTPHTAQQVDNLIRRANSLPAIHGILVCYPIYNIPYILGLDVDRYRHGQHWSIETTRDRMQLGCPSIMKHCGQQGWANLKYKSRDDYFRNLVALDKDVEGLSRYYQNRTLLFRNPQLYVDRYPYNDHNDDADADADDEARGDQGHGTNVVFPCTALAVVRILKQCLSRQHQQHLLASPTSTSTSTFTSTPHNPSFHFTFDPSKPVGKRFENLNVTIINRSQIFGRPLASMLANDGANVYSVDEDSILFITTTTTTTTNQSQTQDPWPRPRLDDYDERTRTTNHDQIDNKDNNNHRTRCFAIKSSVRECIQKSSVVITGVPSSSFSIPSKWIQPGSTVINVASEPNVNEDELRHVGNVQYIGQVGKVTVALLEQNLVRLHQLHHQYP